MAKLTDDQIKWTLILDAKGVQGEINKLSSDIRRLEQDNRNLEGAMASTRKELAENEKEMQKLEKAGKTSSDRYKELQNNSSALRDNIRELKKEIDSNNQSIKNHEKSISDNIKSMKLSDMTMAQLKQRAAELKSQLEVTSRSANPEEFEKLNKELKSVEKQMSENNVSTHSLSETLEAIPGPVGGAIKSVKGLGTAFKALIANPVGIIIMAVVTAFMLLKNIVEGNKDAMTLFNGASQALLGVLDSLKRIATEVFSLLWNLVTLDFEGMKGNANAIADMTTSMAENASAAFQAAYAEKALEEQIARNNSIMAVNNAYIAEQRQKMQDVSLSLKERLAASKEVAEYEEKNYKMQLSNLTEAYDVFKQKNANIIDEIKRNSGAQYAEMEKYMDLIQSGTELTLEQRLALANLVNDITDNLSNATDEQREELRKMVDDMSVIQEEYHQKTREQRNEAARVAFQAEEKALSDHYRNLEKALNDKILNDSSLEKISSLELLEIKKKELNDKVALYRKYGKEVGDILLEISQTEIDIKNEKMNQELKGLDEQQKQVAMQLGQQYLDGKKTKEEYEASLLKLSEVYAQKKLEVLKKYGADTTDAEKAVQDNQIKAYTTKQKKTAEEQEKELRATMQTYKKRDGFLKKMMQQELEETTRTLEQEGALESDIATARAAIVEDYQKKRYDLAVETEEKVIEAVVAGVEGSSAALDEMSGNVEVVFEEVENASEAHANSIVSIFGKMSEALQNMNFEGTMGDVMSVFEATFSAIDTMLADNSSWDKKATAILGTMSSALNAIQALSQQTFALETAALEKEKNEQLALVGDNAEEREKIEQEYAEKELELKKKQANVDAGIQIAQSLIQLATGIVTIWATAMQLGPIVGPIMAGILSAAMTATAGVQIAMINKQRLAIQSQTLDGGGSSGGNTPTGQMVVKSGYAEGGYTGDGGKYEIAGYLSDGSPYHKGEYIIAQEELSNPLIASVVRGIEGVRRKRTNANALPDSIGFADGGYTSSVSSESNTDLATLMLEIKILLAYLRDNGVRAELNYYEFEDTQKKVEYFRRFSKKR